jgi:hypothetical protein
VVRALACTHETHEPGHLAEFAAPEPPQ